MERFRRYKEVLKLYGWERLRWKEFFLLAGVLYLFLADMKESGLFWMAGIGYLFISFLFFRLLDDAGSVWVDRVDHPDRKYLDKDHFIYFFRSVIAFGVIYLLLLLSISYLVVLKVGLLLLVSAISYLIFGKDRKVIRYIPLMKYPLLLWAISVHTPTEVLLVPFLMMFLFDVLDDEKHQKKRKIYSVLTLSVGSFLAFSSYIERGELLLFLTFSLVPLLVVIPFSRFKVIKYVPLLYYPIIHFILTNY